MEFKGRVIAVLPLKSGVSKAGTPWQAQEYVVENDDQYPRKMCFDVFGEEKIKRFNIQMGEVITVQFDVDAHQWQDRWFNSLRAWRIDREPVGQPVQPVVQPAPGFVMPPFPAPTAEDDLPF